MKNTCLLFSVTILLLASSFLIAHAPSGIELSFDVETNMLTVLVEHQVRNTESHYVERITVKSNDVEIIVHNISEQEKEASISFVYRIPDAKMGDTISVTAKCNRIGNMTRQLTIGE